MVTVSSLVQSGARSHLTASFELPRLMHGIQEVLSVERQYTAWNGMILGLIYRGIPSLTVVYRGKPLSFSTQVWAQITASSKVAYNV